MMCLKIHRSILGLAVSFGLIAGGAEAGLGRARNSARQKTGLRRIGGILAISLFLFAATGRTQITTPTDTVASPIPGVGHDYIKMLNETVNPENGAVNLNISIPTPPGRQLSFPFSIQYNSNQTLFEAVAYPSGVGLGWFSGVGEFDSGPWSYSVPNLSRRPYVLNVYWAGELPGGVTPDNSLKCGVMDSYTFTAIDGSQYPLPLAHIYDNVDTGYANTSGNGLDYACANAGKIVAGGLTESDTASAGPYQAVLTGLPAPSDCCAANPPEPNDGNPWIAGPDGTVYKFSGLDPTCTEISEYCYGTVPATIEDRNGNIVNLRVAATGTGPSGSPPDIYSLNVTDTLGRPLISAPSFGQNGSTITVSGDPGSYTIYWENFTYSGYTLTAQNESLMTQCGAYTSFSTGSQTETVISSIVLPNGQSYSFTYDSQYGLISKITYPSGGYVSYTYGVNANSALVTSNADTGGGTGVVITPGVCFYRADAIAVATRNVSFDGHTPAQQQIFSYAPTIWGSGGATNTQPWTQKTTTVTTKDELLNTSYVTNYVYAGQTFTSSVNYPNVYTVSVEQSVSTTQGSTTLKTVTQGWSGPYILDCEVDTFGSASFAKYYAYGPGNQVNDIQEFLTPPGSCQSTPTQDNSKLFPPNGSTPTRETAISYQHFGATPIFPSAPSIFDRPSQIVTKASGSVVAQTNYSYDQNPTGPASVPTGTHDSAYGTALVTPRGNATTIVKCLQNCPSLSPTTTLNYDETGQITSIIDPCGNGDCADMPAAPSSHTTKFSYTDNPSPGGANPGGGNSNAYLTQIIYPTPPDGATLQESFTYNYATGELASSTDQNNHNTYYYYADPLLRPTQVIYPDGGETEYSYNDSPPFPTVTTCTLMNGSAGASCNPASPPPGWKTSVAVMDEMGHVIQTQLASDPFGIDYVYTNYDGEGRVHEESNPTRCTSSSPNIMPSSCGESTWGYATINYDPLGRKISQTDSDFVNTQSWNYSNYTVTYTDENHNQWQRTSDGFGRLIQVSEPNGTSRSPSMNTTYGYDALNNLLSVTQNGASGSPRNRSFNYDSLSRLICASNPENSTTACPATGYVAGTTGYTYDANGNVQSKQDARGIVVSYGYDNLNRLYQKTYSTASASTTDPTVCMQYDLPGGISANTLGRLTMEWTQTAGSVCPALTSTLSAPPNIAITGRAGLVYDPRGRLVSEAEYTPASIVKGTSYPMNYTYDLAGDLTSSTTGAMQPSMTLSSPASPCAGSPSFSTTAWMFVNCYDGAGHLTSVTGNAGTGPTGLFSASSYAPFGGRGIATYGNSAVSLTRGYDNRLRVTSENDMGNSPASATSGSATVTITGQEQVQ